MNAAKDESVTANRGKHVPRSSMAETIDIRRAPPALSDSMMAIGWYPTTVAPPLWRTKARMSKLGPPQVLQNVNADDTKKCHNEGLVYDLVGTLWTVRSSRAHWTQSRPRRDRVSPAHLRVSSPRRVWSVEATLTPQKMVRISTPRQARASSWQWRRQG